MNFIYFERNELLCMMDALNGTLWIKYRLDYFFGELSDSLSLNKYGNKWAIDSKKLLDKVAKMEDQQVELLIKDMDSAWSSDMQELFDRHGLKS